MKKITFITLGAAIIAVCGNVRAADDNAPANTGRQSPQLSSQQGNDSPSAPVPESEIQQNESAEARQNEQPGATAGAQPDRQGRTSTESQTDRSATSPRATDQPAQAERDESPGSGHLSQDEIRFLKESASAGMLEVQLGKLAQEKGQSQEVKDYGRQMVEDHQKANDKLKQILQKEKVELPSDLLDKHQEILDRFQNLEGAEFDQAYARQMVQDHQDVVSAFEKAQERIENQEIKTWVENTTRHVRHHLEKARDLSANAASSPDKEASQPQSGSQPQPQSGRPGASPERQPQPEGSQRPSQPESPGEAAEPPVETSPESPDLGAEAPDPPQAE